MQNINMALSFNDLVEKVDGWVWGWPLIIIILCAGVWLTVRTGFVQVKHLGKALKFMVKNEENGEVKYHHLRHFVQHFPQLSAQVTS